METIESWIDIKEYEGLYQVSDLGRVRVLDRMKHCGQLNGKEVHRIQRGHILKEWITPDDYCQVGLTIDKKRQCLLVHRLVAAAFVPNPLNLPEVNHVKSNRRDNRASQLEWVDRPANILHSYRAGYKTGRLKGKSGKDVPASRAVLQCDLTGKVVKEWESITDANKIGGFCSPNIIKVAKGRQRKHKGFIWKYVEAS